LSRGPSGPAAEYYEKGGRLAFYTGFAAFLSLPIVGYFYAHILKYHANEAYVNLMWGKGDVVAGGIDWWWLKHLCVAAMLGMSLAYFFRSRDQSRPFSLPGVMVASVSLFYVMFYAAMGMIMTWAFFWWMLFAAVVGAALAVHGMNRCGGSARSVYVWVGILSLATVILGGYAREAARPRFVNRVSHYDNVYVPEERGPYLMVEVDPATLPPRPVAVDEPEIGVLLIRERCSGCHTLERVKNYPLDNWQLIVDQMRAYGLQLSTGETRQIVEHLSAKKPY
jgi:hypothetical protein